VKSKKSATATTAQSVTSTPAYAFLTTTFAITFAARSAASIAVSSPS
jgi:hypothetical protein